MAEEEKEQVQIPQPVEVWYPGTTKKDVGLILHPGWNYVPEQNAKRLLERGICVKDPSAESLAEVSKVLDADLAGGELPVSSADPLIKE